MRGKLSAAVGPGGRKPPPGAGPGFAISQGDLANKLGSLKPGARGGRNNSPESDTEDDEEDYGNKLVNILNETMNQPNRNNRNRHNRNPHHARARAKHNPLSEALNDR